VCIMADVSSLGCGLIDRRWDVLDLSGGGRTPSFDLTADILCSYSSIRSSQLDRLPFSGLRPVEFDLKSCCPNSPNIGDRSADSSLRIKIRKTRTRWTCPRYGRKLTRMPRQVEGEFRVLRRMRWRWKSESMILMRPVEGPQSSLVKGDECG